MPPASSGKFSNKADLVDVAKTMHLFFETNNSNLSSGRNKTRAGKRLYVPLIYV
jgi:hypothetical protein